MVHGGGGGGGGGVGLRQHIKKKKRQHFPGFAATSSVGPPHSPKPGENSPPPLHVNLGQIDGDSHTRVNEEFL